MVKTTGALQAMAHERHPLSVGNGCLKASKCRATDRCVVARSHKMEVLEKLGEKIRAVMKGIQNAKDNLNLHVLRHH